MPNFFKPMANHLSFFYVYSTIHLQESDSLKLCKLSRDYERIKFLEQLLPKCQEMQCQYKCAIFKNGTRCYCEEGYEVGTNGKTCQDLNECNLYGICSQTCGNTEGSYICSCVEGYLLQPDKKSCKIKREMNDSPPVLLVANSDTIEILYLNGTRASTLGFVKGTAIQTLDFIFKMDTICWIESRGSSSQLKCIKTSRTGMLTDEWIISTIPYLHSKYLKFG
ncbi:Low-density lipoprotein receptor-related protein 1B [Varanus komodoensis]|nr:Low-density lipoprotein receptor-related protein 1B [Varanus komodoensis]